MRKSVKFISIAILSLGVATTMIGCDSGEDYNAPKEEASVTEEAKTEESVKEETKREPTESEKELIYMIGTQTLLETVRDSQDEVMRLFGGQYNTADQKWLDDVSTLGLNIEKACDVGETAEVPTRFAESDKMLKDAMYDLRHFARNAQDMTNYVNNAGSVETLVRGLSTGISKLSQSVSYRTTNESKQ